MADQTVQSKFIAVGGGEIQLGITRKPITSWGGLAVFAAFYGLGRWALGLLPPAPQGYTLDLDSTVLERFGEQEGVLPGYNPRRHGRPTHHPLLAGLAGAKWILHGWLRSGNVATANNVRAFMDECLALLAGLGTIHLVRADNGFFDGKFLDYLEGKDLPYLVKARMTKQVKLAVLGVSDWGRVGKGIEVGESSIKLLGWSRERRLVVIRQEGRHGGLPDLQRKGGIREPDQGTQGGMRPGGLLHGFLPGHGVRAANPLPGAQPGPALPGPDRAQARSRAKGGRQAAHAGDPAPHPFLLCRHPGTLGPVQGAPPEFDRCLAYHISCSPGAASGVPIQLQSRAR